MTDTDLRAELDAAITAARDAVADAIGCHGDAMWRQGHGEGPSPELSMIELWAALDRYGDLCDVRARWDEHAVVHRRDTPEKPMWCGRCPEIEAAVRRLLPGDGPTEAHSARNDDQSSG